MEKTNPLNPWTHFPAIPSSTIRTARSIYSPESFYLLIGEHLDSLFSIEDWEDLATLADHDAKLADRMAQMLMITIFQFVEDIPDQYVKEALSTRTDWKYALHLPLDYPGLHLTNFAELRNRLLDQPVGLRVFNHVLARIKAIKPTEIIHWHEVDAATVFVIVRTHSQLRLALETMQMAIESLAIDSYAWLQTITPAYWYARYYYSSPNYLMPRQLGERQALLRAIVADGFLLLAAIQQASAPPCVCEMPEIQNLECVWHKQFATKSNHPRPAET